MNASTVKRRTLMTYTQDLTLHILPTFGGEKIQRLLRGQIKALLASKLQQGLSKNTVRIMHATLQAMLKAAADDGVILSNPAEKLGRQLHLVASAATRHEEIKAMIGEQRHLFLTTVRKG